jgi:hypothetical protein
MRATPLRPNVLATALISSLSIVVLTACDGNLSSYLNYFGTPFGTSSSSGSTTTGTSSGGGFGVGTPTTITGSAGGLVGVDACSQPEASKFIRITLRNDIPTDTVHYFLAFIAFIDDGTGSGAVCEDDIALYRSNGYTIQLADGELREFGNFCITGPALIRFHESGRFQNTSGTGLASAIAPAQGSISTFDSFFTSAGATLPVPDQILWHNPGTGEGAALKVSINDSSPCAFLTNAGTPDCDQDAFYYVTDDDIPVGGRALGAGSFRRTPNEIQGTGCQAIGTNTVVQELAPAGTTTDGAGDNEFLRGGSITYVFIRDDQEPPIPQLVWQVRNANGALVHDFDVRTGVE